MKKLILLTLACVFASVLSITAQTRSAEFPGGRKALDKYIYSNLRTDNLKRKLSRRFPTANVVMEYSINKEGRLVRLGKISSPHSGFTDEVARVFRRMPRWKPAIRNGQPYLTTHRYTVKFDLRDNRSSSSRYSSSANNITRSAEFPGGRKALDKYIYSNLRTDNLKRKLGRRFPTPSVVMEYSINKEGRLVRLGKISSPHGGLTDEVARVFRRMPRWKPAMRNGQPYLTTHRYTVKFDLRDSRSSSSSRYSSRTTSSTKTSANIRPTTSSSASRSRYTPRTTTSTRKNITRDAQFPGGKAALDNFVKNHLEYPASDPKIVWPVDVKIRFTIKADGSVSHTYVLRTTDIDYTIMAERIIHRLPKWQPAMRNGKTIESTQIYTVHYPANAKNPNEVYYKGKSDSYNQADLTFKIVQVMPYYPGGNRVMRQDIEELMTKYYPAEAKRKGIEGRVIVKYIVEKDGSIRHVDALRSTNRLFNAAAVKIMTNLPKHAPGLQRGHKVRVEFTRSILFRLKPIEVDYSSQYRH